MSSDNGGTTVYSVLLIYVLYVLCNISIVSHSRMPILYDSMSGGRFLCILFFLCLTLASLSSMVSLLERVILLSVDFGSMYTSSNCTIMLSVFDFSVNRIPATIIITLIIFFVGLGSAINIDILVNQVCICISMYIVCTDIIL